MEVSLNNSLSKVINPLEEKIFEAEKLNILTEIKKVKSALQEAYSNFDYVADSLLVDYYTYQIKAYEAKFEYLIKQAKTMGICEI